MTENKFYDLEPRSGSHCLIENGDAIARFDELAKAEAVRALYVQEVASRG
jgi:hypothetical protein